MKKNGILENNEEKMKLWKVLLIGIVWTAFYAVGAGLGLDFYFGYTPLRIDPTFQNFDPHYVFKDWIFLYDAFMSGEWVIRHFKEWLLIVAFLGFFPGWIFGWWYFGRIAFWKKLKIAFTPKPRKPKNNGKIKLKRHVMERPRALSTRTFAAAPPVRNLTKPAEDGILTPRQPAEDFKPAVLSQQPGFEKAAIERVKEIGSKFGFDVLDDIPIADTVIPIVFATPVKAYFIKFLNNPDREWIADEAGENPVWFYASGQETSPFFLLKKAAMEFAKEEPDSVIKPLLVLLGGAIINGEDMIKEWETLGGMVVRFDTMSNEGMYTLEEYMEKEAAPAPVEEGWEDQNVDV